MSISGRQPDARQHKVVVERDVWMTMRDGTKISANIYRPDAPGRFPAIHAADSYQKDLDHLPLLPIFRMRETNDIDYFVSRGVERGRGSRRARPRGAR